ncbi:MAG: hypothetical protein AB1767_06985 [Bacillota bacterium]
MEKRLRLLEEQLGTVEQVEALTIETIKADLLNRFVGGPEIGVSRDPEVGQLIKQLWRLKYQPGTKAKQVIIREKLHRKWEAFLSE